MYNNIHSTHGRQLPPFLSYNQKKISNDEVTTEDIVIHDCQSEQRLKEKYYVKMTYQWLKHRLFYLNNYTFGINCLKEVQ